MHLTSFTDFGLRALMRLAGDPARSFTTDEIAKELRISRHHLTKVVRRLAGLGYVATQRGAGGGLRLARPPGAITLGEIVRSLEGRYPLVECFRAVGGACVLTPGCRLKARLATAGEVFFQELDRTTLARCAYSVPPDGNTAARPGSAPAPASAFDPLQDCD